MTESMRLHDQAQQVRRVAHVLGVQPDQLAALAHVPTAELRQLHDQLANWLFDVHADSFARVAGVSKVIPGAIAGKLAERFLQPALAARAAVMLEPGKARDLVNKVSVPYLADVTLSLDPVRGQPVIRVIPPARVAEVAKELFDRGELAAMAEFAGSVDKPALDAALTVATPTQLVQVAPLLTWNDNIEQIIDELPDARIDAILAAIAEDSLWVEASVLLRQLRAETLGRVVDRLAALPHVAAQIPTELVGELAVDLFETGELATMALFVPVVHAEALTAAIEVAGADNLLRIAPLIEWSDTVLAVLESLPDSFLDAVLSEVVEKDLFAEGEALVDQLDVDLRSRLVARMQAAPPDLLSRIRDAVLANTSSPALRELVDAVDSSAS
jgi:hypothetical protein